MKLFIELADGTDIRGTYIGVHKGSDIPESLMDLYSSNFLVMDDTLGKILVEGSYITSIKESGKIHSDKQIKAILLCSEV